MSGKGQGQMKQQSKQKMILTQPPPKKDKRTHSDVSNDSVDQSLDIPVIQTQLDTICNDIGELKESLNRTLKKDEIEALITSTVTHIMEGLEKSLKETIEANVTQKTKQLHERIMVLEYDNKMLTDKVEKMGKETKSRIQELTNLERSNEQRSREAMQKANYNEQYSRKNNIKIANVQEDKGETKEKLEEKIQEILTKHGIKLEASEIVAVHRIPSKRSDIKPVLIKTLNNESKVKLMKKRKEMKNDGHRISDDVTNLNTGLINRLSRHEDISNAWFFNGSVYGETTRNERIKFDIFDNIGDIIQKYRQSKTTK